MAGVGLGVDVDGPLAPAPGLALGLDGNCIRGLDHARALEALRTKYPQYRAMELHDRPVIRLTPEQVNDWGFD